MDGVANTPVNQNQPPQIIGGTLGGALNPLGGSLPPANITTQLPGLAASTPGATPSGIGATVNSAIGAANPPLDSAGALDETRFVEGQQYRMPDGSVWRWSGRDLKPVDPRAGTVNEDALDYLDELEADGENFSGEPVDTTAAPRNAAFGVPPLQSGQVRGVQGVAPLVAQGQPADNALSSGTQQADEDVRPSLPVVPKPPPSFPSDSDEPSADKPEDGDGDENPDEPQRCEDLPPGHRQNLLTSHRSAESDVRRLRGKMRDLEGRIYSLDAAISDVEQQLDEWSPKASRPPVTIRPKVGKSAPPKTGRPRGRLGRILEWAEEAAEALEAGKHATERTFAEYERLTRELVRLQKEKENTEVELAETRAEHERVEEFANQMTAYVKRLGCDWTVKEWYGGGLESSR